MLELAGHSYPDDALLIMAIVNRTPDSFYDRGATYAFDKAFERVAEVVAAGAEIVDIGGVKAAPGDEVDAAEEIRRTVDFVARVRSGVPRAGDLGGHLAARGGTGGLPGRGEPAQRRLGRARPAAGRGGGRVRRRAWCAPTPVGCGRVPGRTGSATTTWSATCCG